MYSVARGVARACGWEKGVTGGIPSRRLLLQPQPPCRPSPMSHTPYLHQHAPWLAGDCPAFELLKGTISYLMKHADAVRCCTIQGESNGTRRLGPQPVRTGSGTSSDEEDQCATLRRWCHHRAAPGATGK